MHRILVCIALALGMLLLFTAAIPVPHGLSDPAPGGAPYITIGGKASGTITRKEWGSVVSVEIKGCVAKPAIGKSTIHFTDRIGKPVTATVDGAKFTPEQKGLIAKLPSSTRFTVSVEVYDGKLKLDVREAVFTLVD